jgi:hypothetical protein
LSTFCSSDMKGSSYGESIISIITKLDTYWTVVEAELTCIQKDIENCFAFQKRYGMYWDSSLGKLNRLKREKEATLRDIKLQMELFHLHIESGRDLCKKLEMIQPLIPHHSEEEAGPSSGETFAVVSKILAHADPMEE